MSTDSKSKKPAKPETELACTVLIARTKVGSHLKGKGAKVKLPESKAKTLAGLNPPAVRIDGV
ncbi:MAG: hypothetical protein AAGB14_00320 [Verrucomicrobiota bacterium]